MHCTYPTPTNTPHEQKQANKQAEEATRISNNSSNDHNLLYVDRIRKLDSTNPSLCRNPTIHTYGWLFQSLRYPLSSLHRAVEASQSSRKPDKCLVLVRFCWEWTSQHKWEGHKRSTAQHSTNTAQQNRGQKRRWCYSICPRSTITAAPTE